MKCLFALLAISLNVYSTSMGVEQVNGTDMGVEQDTGTVSGGTLPVLSDASRNRAALSPDSIWMSCSLTTGTTATIIYQVSMDKLSILKSDSVTGKDAPYLYRDTATELTDSTLPYYRFIAHDAGGADTTPWDSIATPGWCSSLFSDIDTTKTWCDAVAITGTVTMPFGGRIISKITIDTLGTIEYDSVTCTKAESPKTYVDTSGSDIGPSTKVFFGYMDSCGNTSPWDSVYTKDSSGFTVDWLYVVPPTITSIDGEDNGYNNDVKVMHGTEFKASGGTLYFNTTILDTSGRSDTQMSFTVAGSTGVGNIIFEDTYGYRDSIAFENLGNYDTATIASNPHDTTVTTGQPVIFYVTATSSGIITYKWQVNDGGGWDDVASSDNDTLTIADATGLDGYLYRCIATDARGADTSTAATLTVSETVYTVTVTDAGNGSTDPVGGQAVADGDSIQIIAIPDAHYHFLRWTRSTTDAVPTDSSNDTTIVTANGNGTMTAVFGIDTFTTTLSDDAHTALSCKTDCIGAYGELDTVILSVSAGWQGFWPGGNGVTGNDTIIVTVTNDSTVTAISYIIPIIDSIKAHTRRDLNRISCARRIDTVTFITSTDIYDSTDQSSVFIGRDTTGQMTITRWFNSGSGLDSIWAIVPADATANKNFRPILRNGYGICSNVRTPVTWSEPWILNVKVMVP